jgi:hypothetical protein
MKRYFFDVVSGTDSRFDYRGREFSAPEKAIEFAKLIAIDLGIMQDVETAQSQVVVRDPQGRSYFSMQIGNLELAAA